MEFYFNEIPLFNKSKINMIKVLIKMIRRNRMLSNSKLGFGLMRLPKDKQGQIKLDEVQRMVDSYMERGFNYFDTAYVYEGSEEAIRQTLIEKYPRDVYTLADKLPAWKLTCQEDVERIFQESLNRTGVDYFDFYLLHSVEKSHYPTYEKYQCFDFIQEMKKQGKIKYMGFSFHDDADFLDKVLTEHPEIDFVQLQLNYLDWENGVIQSRRNYEVARKHHKPIIVMEPVKGGTLASFSDDIERIYKDYAPQKSIASIPFALCCILRWCYDNFIRDVQCIFKYRIYLQLITVPKCMAKIDAIRLIIKIIAQEIINPLKLALHVDNVKVSVHST